MKVFTLTMRNYVITHYDSINKFNKNWAMFWTIHTATTAFSYNRC